VGTLQKTSCKQIHDDEEAPQRKKTNNCSWGSCQSGEDISYEKHCRDAKNYKSHKAKITQNSDVEAVVLGPAQGIATGSHRKSKKKIFL